MNNYITLIKRAAAQLRTPHYSYIAYCEGHKNSQGEEAPWCIKDHDSDSILSSYTSKEKAEEGLRNIHIHKKTAIDIFKQKEICVWIRLQHDMDKFEILDFIMKKFGVSADDGEDLYYKALPEGLSSNELELLSKVAADMSNRNISASDAFILIENASKDCTCLTDIIRNLQKA